MPCAGGAARLISTKLQIRYLLLICIALTLVGLRWAYTDREVLHDTLRQRLRAGQYAELEQNLSALQRRYEADFRVESELVHSLAAFAHPDPALQPALDAWVHRYPNSAIAKFARGTFFQALGWKSRGEKYAGETTPEQFAGMRALFAKANADYDRALALNPKMTVVYTQKLNIERAAGDATERRRLLTAALALDPNSYDVRQEYMFGLRPEWGGSFAQVESFLAETQPYVANNPELIKLESIHYYGVGLEQYNQKQFSLALATFNRALASSPKDSLVLQYRALTHAALGNGPSALADFELCAELDRDYCKTRAGTAYARGDKGVTVNYEKAIKWLTRAAAPGSDEAYAQYYLGWMYLNGAGVNRDPAATAQWWQKAAVQGERQAQSGLGALYWDGVGVARDPAAAEKWWRAAAAQGDEYAQRNLAHM